MKTAIRICIWLFVVLCMVCVGADCALRYVSRRPVFKQYVLRQAQEALQREVRAERITASIYGLGLVNAAISEEGGFGNGTFLTVPRARIYFSFSHLLRLHLKIKTIGLQEPQIELLKQADGTFNFETLGGASAQVEAQPEAQTADDNNGSAWLGILSVGAVDLRKATVLYEDIPEKQVLRLDNLNITVNRFAFDKEFAFDLNTVFSYAVSQQEYVLNIALRAKAFLNNLDFSQAYLILEDATVKHQNTLLQLNGRVDNWTSPSFSLKALIKKLSSKLVRPWATWPLFEIPKVLLSVSGNTDTEKQQVVLSDFSITLGGADVSGAGQFNYQTNDYTANGKFLFDFAALLAWLPSDWQHFILKTGTLTGTAQAKTGTVGGNIDLQVPAGNLQANGYYNYAKNVYDVDGTFQADLDETSAHFPKSWQKLGLKGDIDGSVNTDSKTITALLHISEGGFFHPAMGHFSNVYATFTAQESIDFSSGEGALDFKGDLNKNPLTATASVTHTPQVIKGKINAYSKRVALPPPPPDKRPQQEEEEFVTDATLVSTEKHTWSLPPLDLQADIHIDSLDAPYLYATDLVFTSDLQGVTPWLNDTHGVLKLSMGNGTILDLYHLTNANPLTKVLFLSLNVVGKVFNSLNVFGVLSKLGKGVASAVSGGKETEETRMVVQPMLDENGKPVEMLVPYTDKKVKGQQDYEKFETEIKFDNGLASIRKGTFVSNMMSMRLDGTTDFNNGEINLKVHAAPGKHEVNGVMPLTVNIGGTVADPKGSMSVMGSVASLVTQGVTKNVVSRNVHKGIKSFFRLFKKKDNSNETETDETETVPADENENLSADDSNLEATSSADVPAAAKM